MFQTRLTLQVLRAYFPSILALAQNVLRSPDPCVVPFGGNMYLHSFGAFDSYCQQARFSILPQQHAIKLTCFLTSSAAAWCLTGSGRFSGDPCVLWRGWGGGHISGAPLQSGERKALRNGSVCCFCQGTVTSANIGIPWQCLSFG